MKLRARSVAWLLPFTLTACIHLGHKQQVQSTAPPVQATPQPDATIVEHPPAKTTNTTQPSTPPATQNAPVQKVTQKPKPSPSKRIPPASSNNGQAANSTAPASTTLEASNQSPAVSVIGQLTSGEGSDARKQTVDLIVATERGLNGIDRKLSDQELKTASQIREYLKQARTALASGDVDGAHTLAAKAKLLLSELNS
jgi:outer membrane biosynthesis protein TonB